MNRREFRTAIAGGSLLAITGDRREKEKGQAGLNMHKWGDEFYLFENIQAEVCRQCGETFFLPDTLKLIDRYVMEKRTSQKTICIPVIEMSNKVIV